MSSSDVGRAGEAYARVYVESLGYKIIGCNVHFGRKEADIVAMDGDIFVAIEVKTRLSRSYGMPEEQISAAKLRSLSHIASRLSAAHPGAAVRVDVISIRAYGCNDGRLTDPNLHHIPNVLS